MTIDEMIAVLQAYKAGRQIQLMFANEPDAWTDCKGPQFDFSTFAYRVKPEPREFWLEPSSTCDGYYVYDKEDAKPYVWRCEAKRIKVREVLE